MSIYMAITLFSFIILLYWIITEAFTLLFRMTGLPDERARFQVTSLLTGCGYTTKESEMFLSSRSRRRLVRITMLFGYVFNITVVSALINVFLSLKESQIGSFFLSLPIPLAAVVVIFIFIRVPGVRAWGDKQLNRLFDKLFSQEVPMIIFTRGLMPDDHILEIARRHNKPMYMTSQATSPFMAEMLRWLNVKLAPCISVHGVLVDVYGVGLLLTGDSGVGKSEAALELIKRGHRLVSDDVVEIRRVSEVTLIGTAPAITKHFIELRGIGIIDVKTLFGVCSVRDSQTIDLEIHLEEWDRNREYDRLGLEENYTEYLGNRVVRHCVPVRPGRNVAIICESAAANHRQKMMGYNAAQELYQRVQSNLMRKNRGED